MYVLIFQCKYYLKEHGIIEAHIIVFSVFFAFKPPQCLTRNTKSVFQAAKKNSMIDCICIMISAISKLTFCKQIILLNMYIQFFSDNALLF